MFATLRESFYDLANYPTDSTTIGTRDIKTYFSETLPNMIYNNDKTMDFGPLTGTINIATGKQETILKNAWKKGEGEVNDNLAARQAECESTGNGDQFDHLTSMASSIDTSARARCGWIYNSTNPDNGRGALGIVSGPIQSKVKGNWMWNLQAAKEKYHTAICQNIQGCADIDSKIYKQRCGWCKKSGKAVPIIGKTVAYPFGRNTGCQPNDLVTSAASCPVPQPITDPSYVRSPAEACVPLQNGALPRDCLLQKTLAAGCSDAGSLYQALRSGSDNNYTSVLSQEQAFKVYQERAAIPLSSIQLQTGKMSISDALDGFKRVQDQGASEANTGVQAAARDLCMKKGAIDEYDFCSEIQDSNPGPFTIECIRKVFLTGGGQKAGRKYPSPNTVAEWNALGSWSAVKAKVQSLHALTRSKDRTVQENAMMDFYGIRLQNKRNPLPYGPEIAYKDDKVLLSANRPIGYPNGYTVAAYVYDENNEMLDTVANRMGFTMGTPPSLRPQCSSPNANVPESVSGWKYKGCFNDCHQGRGLPNFIGRVGSIEQCIALAKSRGFNTSGNQYYGECWAGNNTDWGRMGNAGCCPPIGGACNQQIYSAN